MSETNKNLNVEMTEQQLENVAGGYRNFEYIECPHCGYRLEVGTTQCAKCLGYISTTDQLAGKARAL